MKGLTLSAVEWMMDLLIHANGQTTTLEVKNALRGIGFYAEQNDVSTKMNELYESNNEEAKLYNCDTNGSYKIYSYTDIITSQVPTAVDVVVPNGAGDPDIDVDIDVLDTDSDEDDNGFSALGLAKYRNSIPVGSAGSGVAVTGSRDPELIFYTDKHVRNSGVDSQSWVVSHVNGNNEIQVYNKDLTRDQVRSRYTSIMKVKIQDVRAKRFSNY